MLLRCPSCGGKIRSDSTSQERFPFLCHECEHIVHLNPGSDMIHTTSSPPPSRERHRKLILVADDSAEFAGMARDLLVKAGFDVIVAKDGMEALKMIANERPDAIFLDLFMPRLTGFEVLRALRTSAAYTNLNTIPVLVTSNFYHTAEFDILNELNVQGYISKDVAPEELVFRIRQLVLPA